MQPARPCTTWKVVGLLVLEGLQRRLLLCAQPHDACSQRI